MINTDAHYVKSIKLGPVKHVEGTSWRVLVVHCEGVSGGKERFELSMFGDPKDLTVLVEHAEDV